MSRWQTFSQQRWFTLAVGIWVVLVGAICVRTYLAPHKGSVFALYREAGRYWTDGETCYDAHRPDPYGGYRYAPVVSAFFVPWTWLPVSEGSAVWRLLNAGVLFGGMAYFMRVLAARRLSPGDWALMLLAMIPLGVGGLNNGQVNSLIVGLLLFAVAGCWEKRWNLAAICLALAVWLKVYPIAVAMLLLLVYPRALAPRFLLGMAVGFGLPFLAQRPEYVWGEYQNWYAFLKADDRRHNPFPIAYLDVHLLLRIIGVHLSHAAYGVLQLGSAASIALYVWVRARRYGTTPHLLTSLFHLASGWMMLFGPSTEGSTYVMLAPTLACAALDAVHERRTAPWQRGAVVAAGALFFARFLWMSLPGGRYFTFAFLPLGTLFLWTERWSRALAGPEEAVTAPAKTQAELRRAG